MHEQQKQIGGHRSPSACYRGSSSSACEKSTSSRPRLKVPTPTLPMRSCRRSTSSTWTSSISLRLSAAGQKVIRISDSSTEKLLPELRLAYDSSKYYEQAQKDIEFGEITTSELEHVVLDRRKNYIKRRAPPIFNCCMIHETW